MCVILYFWIYELAVTKPVASHKEKKKILTFLSCSGMAISNISQV